MLPVPLIGPEKVPLPVMVNVVGFKLSVPAPLSVAILCAVLLKVAVPPSASCVEEESVAPESTVKSPVPEVLTATSASEPGEAISNEPAVIVVAPL